ncbi:hypothetical protein IPM62_02940 [Candidatus Woesebacteria bacterium]|nr:MAG: hypothetical protein IPM62_02940 [Candidatus Woesebacteria bacterium]
MKNHKGQSLFEIVITVGISALIIVGVVSLANKTLGNTNAARDRSLAARYVQEMTECLRKQRDANWDTFIANGATSCVSNVATQSHFTGKTILLNCFDKDENAVLCSLPTAVQAEADVAIGWDDGSGSHVVRTITRFTDWRRQ